jgi:hypothetical protein
MNASPCHAAAGNMPQRTPSPTPRSELQNHLTYPRYALTSIVVGKYLYVFGGEGPAQMDAIERAPILPEGNLGTFHVVPDIRLLRWGATAHVLGSYLYVIGEGLREDHDETVIRAPIDSEGNLKGRFTPVPGVRLVEPRVRHSSHIIGSYLYVLGGISGDQTVPSVERARIHPDGRLGPFSLVPGVEIRRPVQGQTSHVIGNRLYLLGDVNDGRIEYAPIRSDGSLGAFTTASSNRLVQPRVDHTATFIGNRLYVFGGGNSMKPYTTIEVAELQPDGGMSPFRLLPDFRMKVGRQVHTSVVLDQSIYLIGGVVYDEKTRTTPRTGSVERVFLRPQADAPSKTAP